MWKSRLRMMVWILGLLLCWGCSDDGPEVPSQKERAAIEYFDTAGSRNIRFDPFVQALKQDLINSQAYGISAAVFQDGQIVFAAAFGSADEAGNIPLTTNTLMQIGSTTKQMTAAALLQKVDANQFALEDSLEQVLPELEFAENGQWDDQISVHQLLSQQSGIVDWATWDAPSNDLALASFTYSIFNQNAYLMNAPGLFFNYSNSNYALAGLITESFDIRSWPDILVEDLFVPLGMTRTYTRKSAVSADGDYAMSFGLHPKNQSGPMQNIDIDNQGDSAWLRPAGLVWTTPKQMMSWAAFMMRGEEAVLSNESREKMMQGYGAVIPDLDISHYGYGLFVDSGFFDETGSWFETPVMWHNGNTLSFTHAFYMLPQYDFAVSICATSFGMNLNHSTVTALKTLTGIAAASSQPDISSNPARYDRHVGRYRDSRVLGDIIVLRDGDVLRVQVPSATQMGLDIQSELEPITSDMFNMRINGQPTDISFIDNDGNGQSDFLRNRMMIAVRVN